MQGRAAAAMQTWLRLRRIRLRIRDILELTSGFWAVSCVVEVEDIGSVAGVADGEAAAEKSKSSSRGAKAKVEGVPAPALRRELVVCRGGVQPARAPSTSRVARVCLSTWLQLHTHTTGKSR